MKPEDQERAYREATYGYDEPGVAYVYGDTLLEMLRKVGDQRKTTNDGRPIVKEGYYELSREGIVLVG